MLHKITKFINPFMAALATAQICIMIAYGVLTYHDGYGNQQKLDEARQAAKDLEDSLREPTPAPQEYEYGQPDLSYMFDLSMYTYLGMCLTMTYLRKYAYTSLGMSFLMGCLAQEYCCLLLQWIPLAQCAMLQSQFKDVGCPYGDNPTLTKFENFQRSQSCTCSSWDDLIAVQISDFIKGQYGVVAVMISFGATLGKVSPLQILIIVGFNVTAYVGNKFLCVDYRGGVDNTGSLYTTHIFGASFGLGCSLLVSGKRPSENPDNQPRYQSNNYAVLGSLFMFITYPSFNCYWAPAALRVYIATNTVMALLSGGMFSYIWANLFYPEGPSIMHLQDGVLAAGVAASTPACMFVTPVFMMVVGAGGSLFATLSFRYLQHNIEDQDSQGITSLHLLPGLWGALVMELVCVLGIDNSYWTLENMGLAPEIMPHYGEQWASTETQALVTAFSLFIGALSGAMTGLIAKLVGRSDLAGSFSDHVFWIVPGDFMHIGDKSALSKIM
jgi:ammonia channel protein AmtB